MSSTQPPRRNVNQNSTQRMKRPKTQNVNRSTNRNINRPRNQNLDRRQPNEPLSQNRNQPLTQNKKKRSKPFGNISHLFDWQLRVGKWLFTVESFLLCIPLKIGSYVIAIISLVKSTISFSLVVVVICNYSSYLEAYEKKMDVFIYILVYFSSCVPFLVTSIFLIIGTYMEKPTMVKLYLWGTIMHIFVCILNTLTFSIYCMVNNYCFQGNGMAHVVINFMYLFFYTVIWLYLLSAINSMLTLQIAAQKLRETSFQPVNQPLGPKANRTFNQPTKKRNVKQTGYRKKNRPLSPSAKRTLNRPTNRPSSPNKYRPSNQPVRRSPKRSLK